MFSLIMLGMVTVTFRIWLALEFLQYLYNHELQRVDFCFECTPIDITCQLYHHQVKPMFILEGTNNLVSGAFLKCFSIYNDNETCHAALGFQALQRVNNLCS